MPLPLMLSLIGSAIFTALLTAALTLLLIEYERCTGRLCRDVHKPYRAEVPCIGGPAYALSIALGFLAASVWAGVEPRVVLALELSVLLGAAVGLLDDLVDLDVPWKVILGALPAIPLLLLRVYEPYLALPLTGVFRMTIVYPFIALLGMTGAANSANMVDTHNGLLVGSASIMLLGALVLELLRGSPPHAVLFTAVALAGLATFYVFNRYPAKVFNGNTGSFLIGSIAAAVAIVSKLEYFFVTAWIPFIMSGFYFMASMKRLVKRDYIPQRPVIVRNGVMYPNTSRGAPITLVHVAVLPNPLTEPELVKAVHIATLFYTVLGMITTLLWM
ncbi:MAG: hypothetical protein DRO39_03545 [Thermoprotei archaeon]|nr:MAG: hypothetical protein DRO39_03545 [Thermoprotei archaeon]